MLGNINWLYSDERMDLRARCLELLFKNYGGIRIEEASYSTEDIYNACHDWVSQGNPGVEGLAQFFEQHYVSTPVSDS